MAHHRTITGTTHLVVVGNGLVGQRFVESLRARDTSGRCKVTVLAEEPRPAYDRVALSTWFTGRTEADLTLVPAGFYDDDPLLDLRIAESAVSIDRAGRTVTTSSGQEIPYDAVVLATGSFAFVPPVDGHDLPGTFVYRTIADLESMKSYAKGRRVGAVIGGGLLGLEAANALLGLGLRTHVVEFAPRLVAVQIDEGGHPCCAAGWRPWVSRCHRNGDGVADGRRGRAGVRGPIRRRRVDRHRPGGLRRRSAPT